MRRASRGFTLLEVLLTLGMVLVLLASLWSLFNVFNRLFEVAPVKAAQARLVAGIVQQLSDDLQSAIDDNAEAPSVAGNAGPVRRFGLAGGSNWLRLDVLQPLPQERLKPQEPGVGDSGPRVPELRTVVYRCAAPVAEQSEQGASREMAESPSARPGLTRWEIDFETPEEAIAAPGAKRSPVTNAAASAQDDATTDVGDLLGLGPADPSATWIPEIVGLQFQYFDGSSWSGSWDSLQHKSLPMAVEVTVLAREADPTSPKHRFVIYLPGARSRPSLHSTELAFATPAYQGPTYQGPTVQPVRVQPVDVRPVEVRPMPTPAAQVPQPATLPPPPDQWMRARQ